MKIPKKLFDKAINYLTQIEAVIKAINELNGIEDNQQIFCHIKYSKKRLQFSRCFFEYNKCYQLNIYGVNSDEPEHRFKNKTPEELWVDVFKGFEVE